MNNQSVKKLVYQILKDEIKEYGIQIDVSALTKIEGILEIIKTIIKSREKQIDTIIETAKDEFYFFKNAYAGYDYSKHQIKVYIDNIKKATFEEDEYLWIIIKSIYHEYKHVLVNENIDISIKSIEEFYYIIGIIINPTDNFYLDHHDNIYDEILANKYGVEKAEKFLKENKTYSKIYTKIKSIIDIEKLLHEIYYQNHDIHPFINKINTDVKNSIKVIDFNSLAPECEIIKILYNKDGTFKTIKNLYQTKRWLELPKEAQLLILSSESYLNEFNYQKSTIEELELILEALNHSYNLESKKTIINRQLRIKLELLSRQLNEQINYNINIYLHTLLTLNEKEKLNKQKIEKIKLEIQKIYKIIEQRTNPSKRKIRELQ